MGCPAGAAKVGVGGKGASRVGGDGLARQWMGGGCVNYQALLRSIRSMRVDRRWWLGGRPAKGGDDAATDTNSVFSP